MFSIIMKQRCYLTIIDFVPMWCLYHIDISAAIGYTFKRVSQHTHTYRYIHTCIYIYIYIHTYIHTHTYTNTHTHMPTYMGWKNVIMINPLWSYAHPPRLSLRRIIVSTQLGVRPSLKLLLTPCYSECDNHLTIISKYTRKCRNYRIKISRVF